MPQEVPRAILPFIRSKTTEARRELEIRIDFPTACQSRMAYEKCLADLWGFYAPLEEELEKIPGWEAFGYRWAERAKTALLRRDLAALGFPEEKIEGLAKCQKLPPPSTLTEAFGCAYVLENGTLGGTQTALALKRSSIPPHAQNFLGSYGSDVAGKWREFCAMLDRIAINEEGQRALIGSALRTFDCLTTWLRAGTPSGL